ncbi:unnamed protein product [Prorocentrum cordatum]|uniref:Uncharacterized protein n=1 Tax=Prorocentrum cordatum TaxID=2364126 RepID=A0ABN9SBC4_9DINO|nr:unnamed protein product [Polarella glacialis]
MLGLMMAIMLFQVEGVRSTARRAPPAAALPKIQRRGLHAWQTSGTDFFEGHKSDLLSGGCPPRLLVHAQMDATARQYMRACRKFCNWAEEQEVEIYPSWRLDKAISVYLDVLCFDDEIGVGEGKSLTSGMLAMYPALRLPEAYRALKAWEGLRPTVQGSPIGVPLLMEIVDQMSHYGEDGLTAADAALLAFDCYLREQDWELMRVSDVVSADGVTAIRLGVQERGERVKTGQEQGVLIDYPGTQRMLLNRIQGKKEDDRIFPISQNLKELGSQKYHDLGERPKRPRS